MSDIHEAMGYERHYSYNLTHPSFFDSILCKKDLEAIRWCILKQPRYMGRVWKKNCPDEPFWKKSDEYFTFYRGRCRNNKGDRMVTFYRKAAPITDQHKRDFLRDLAQEQEEVDEPLY